MKTPYRLCCVLLVCAIAVSAYAQRPRTISGDTADAPKSTDETKIAPPPDKVSAKYEGGVVGYNKKEEGTLSFDDRNERLIFNNKLGKETVSIPFSSIIAAYGDTRSLQPAAATVISNIPSIYALPARFFKQKYEYLTLQYSDPDNGSSGLTSFKLENKEILASELVALATKSGLTQRGDGYVRRKAPAPVDNTANNGGSDSTTISGGVMNGKAVALPRPDYPDAARDQKISGSVTVQVTVDEQGSVVDAKAVSGDAMLYEAAENAARKARFFPAVVNGRPVKVIGVLNYNFVL